MVSAIILSYNRCAEVLLTVSLLKAHRQELPFDLEIIVVDNASADGTSLQVKAQHPDITLIAKSQNSGVAGWNDGFRLAKHSYFLVLDDDSYIENGLSEAIDYLNLYSQIGVLALNVSTGPYTNDLYHWKDKQSIAGFIGCGAIIRKKVVDEIGGFAEWIHIYGHEWDYAIRCLNAGYEVQYFANSIVIHRASSINRANKRLKIYCTRNEMGIVYKHFSSNRLKYLIRMWINGLKCIKSEGFMSACYCMAGAMKFLLFRKKLQHSPVSERTQNFYAQNFHSTQPIFGFLTKLVRSSK